MADFSFKERLGMGLYAAGGGDASAYVKLKQEAEQWRIDQAQKAIDMELKFASGGFQPDYTLPSGASSSGDYHNIQYGDQVFSKPVRTQKDKTEDLMAQAKQEAFRKLPPALQEQFALTGKLPNTDAMKLQLMKFAEQQAFRKAGGSFMMGIKKESSDKYDSLQKEIYNSLAKEYGITGKLPVMEETQQADEEEAVETNLMDTDW